MLSDVIKREIEKQNGLIGVDEFMRLALMHPEFGYYQKQLVFGADGDFITAPEISQMFGELLAIWILHVVPNDKPLHVIELGGGRGTLMADIARILRKFDMSFRITMLEASKRLQKIQHETLKEYAPVHCEDADEITYHQNEYPIIIANEFFDALPAKQYVSDGGGWYERMVGIKEGKLYFTRAPLRTELEIPPQKEALSVQAIEANTILQKLCDKPVYALIFDYGFDHYPAYGDSLQAVKNHKAVDVFESLGEADLTMHVDFHALKKAILGLPVRAWGAVPQGLFLERLGLITRAKKLIAQNPQNKNDIEGALHRLLAPSQMGQLFKVLALTPNHITLPPAGFTDGLSS